MFQSCTQAETPNIKEPLSGIPIHNLDGGESLAASDHILERFMTKSFFTAYNLKGSLALVTLNAHCAYS